LCTAQVPWRYASVRKMLLEPRAGDAVLLLLIAVAASSVVAVGGAYSSSQLRAVSRAGYHCGITLPTGEAKAAKFQKPYYDKLFKVLVDGNGKGLEGSHDNTFREGYVKDHESEMQCLYALMLKDFCDGLPSRHDERQEEWELRCLDPKVRMAKIYELMSENEMLYFRRLKRSVAEKAVYNTMLEWTGEKELACMQMKVVDDKCLGPFEGPRLLPDWYWETGVAPTEPPHVPKPNTGSKWFDSKAGDESSTNSTQAFLLANVTAMTNATIRTIPVASVNTTSTNATSPYQALRMPKLLLNVTTARAIKAPTRYFKHL